MLAVVLVVVLLAGTVAALGSAAAARHRAEAAADLAALAAADVVLGRAADAGGACGRAGRVATAHGALLTSCAVAPDGSVTVEVRCTPGGAPALLGPASASARAGPGTVAPGS
ncbi:hypothetical protein NUM3379_23210 [Kineococcus sp. NUM-3379]